MFNYSTDSSFPHKLKCKIDLLATKSPLTYPMLVFNNYLNNLSVRFFMIWLVAWFIHFYFTGQKSKAWRHSFTSRLRSRCVTTTFCQSSHNDLEKMCKLYFWKFLSKTARITHLFLNIVYTFGHGYEGKKWVLCWMRDHWTLYMGNCIAKLA